MNKKSATLAGVARFELANEGVKVPCLTAWLYPYMVARITRLAVGVVTSDKIHYIV